MHHSGKWKNGNSEREVKVNILSSASYTPHQTPNIFMYFVVFKNTTLQKKEAVSIEKQLLHKNRK